MWSPNSRAWPSALPGDLLHIIRTQPPGSEVKLEVIRNNKMGDIIARLGELPDAAVRHQPRGLRITWLFASALSA
jgi:hypothetical protein